MPIHIYRLLILTTALLNVGQTGFGDDKATAIAAGESPTNTQAVGKMFTRPASLGKASRTMLTEGEVQVPLLVVRGTPYEMGRQLGVAMQDEIRAFIPATLKGVSQKLGVSIEDLQNVWENYFPIGSFGGI